MSQVSLCGMPASACMSRAYTVLPGVLLSVDAGTSVSCFANCEDLLQDVIGNVSRRCRSPENRVVVTGRNDSFRLLG
jgi:hypothetical protein